MSRKKVKDRLKKQKELKDSIPDVPISFQEAFDKDFISKGTGSRRKVQQKKGAGSIPSRRKMIENVVESMRKAREFNEKEGNITKKARGGVVGGQKKLDMNKDGKLTKVDFQMLGNKSKPFKGKIDTDKEKLVSENGKTMVVKKAKGGSIQVSGTNFSGVY
jgi:hypothetical protein